MATQEVDGKPQSEKDEKDLSDTRPSIRRGVATRSREVSWIANAVFPGESVCSRGAAWARKRGNGPVLDRQEVP